MKELHDVVKNIQEDTLKIDSNELLSNGDPILDKILENGIPDDKITLVHCNQMYEFYTKYYPYN